MNLHFDKISNPKIKNCFTKVLKRYESLHNQKIYLTKQRLKMSTMQAQPIISVRSLWKGINKYQIKLGKYVMDSRELKVSELSEEVLVGWFAHELGHVVDYASRSNAEMAAYGLKYLISDKFKREVEHTADRIAIKNGFYDEIIATKTFILEHELIGEQYKNNIIKYYMSIEDVRLCQEDELFQTTVI